MSARLVDCLTSLEPFIRDQALEMLCAGASASELLAECEALEAFRRQSPNLYHRVRALMFLYAIHRFHLPQALAATKTAAWGLVPFEGYNHLLARRFEEAIDVFRATQRRDGPGDGLCSAMAAAYKELAFQTLANQVRRSVRSVHGNQWMFRIGHPADQPLRIRGELLEKGPDGSFGVMVEKTPVRMDLSHSAWSDIFFLGMDYPEGARVLNVSIDLGIHGRDVAPRPPVEAYLRVIEEPVLQLVSVDLGATARITTLPEVFDFAKDYLGLLKAAVIASGIIPPGVEGSGQSLADLLERLVGPGLGLEIVSSVNNIPKGSRLAVSTNLLGCLIAVCMRATCQTHALTGPLEEPERRLVAARAILGEWLAGSGGGWQDSGGLWPGMKLIEGSFAKDGDSEFGISRGRLLPTHRILGDADASPQARQALQDSLVLVHGGMAQNVGPILEMVTEKYLLRSAPEWRGRKEAGVILEGILAALRKGDIPAIGDLTTGNFQGPIQTIIPWASNAYTEALIDRIRRHFGCDFWGFWMLGGMSGGGMGFIFNPRRKIDAQAHLLATMTALSQEFKHALPFAMAPVVYDFAINHHGTCAQFLRGPEALLPQAYYAMMLPQLLHSKQRDLTLARRVEIEAFGDACRKRPELSGTVQAIFDRLFGSARVVATGKEQLSKVLEEFSFDREQHERIRLDLRRGRIGLAQSRLPANTVIQDIRQEDVIDATRGVEDRYKRIGQEALAQGAVGVVTLAAGVGSRWTQGAGVVKALNPFCKLAGKHRTFVEAHLAKSRRSGRLAGTPIEHILTTSYLTHQPIQDYLAAHDSYGYFQHLHLSGGHGVGLRMVPMVRDLRYAWEEMPQKVLDQQAQKVQMSMRNALLSWAISAGEGSDYSDNLPLQCLHPVGHWYEVPNLLRNGVLCRLLAQRPGLRYLMLHNVDTLGANLDPSLLGLHIAGGAALSFEVINRRIEDRGGGLARVNGRVRLVEGLAMPREEDEFGLSYYNSMTTWIDIDRLLEVFGLSRGDLADAEHVATHVRDLAARMPTYITIKDVKKRWGYGQEDIFPVAQWEKLWSDMTALPELPCGFFVVPRLRGQQLKDPAQLDAWLRDGSAAYVELLGDWE